MCLKNDSNQPKQTEVKDGEARSTPPPTEDELIIMSPEVQQQPQEGSELQIPASSELANAPELQDSASSELANAPDLQNSTSEQLLNEYESVVLIVRDCCGHAVSLNKQSFYPLKTSTVNLLLHEVGKAFKYEPNSFSLVYQQLLSLGGHDVDINDIEPDKQLGELDLKFGSNCHNSLLLCNLRGAAPRRTDEDDLSLGASASPTSASSTGLWFEATKDASPRITNQSVGYVGLVNQAMTCYLNSLLQTLYMTPEFRNALYRWEFKGTPEEAIKNIPFQLQKLFLQLQTTPRSAVETTNLTKSFGWDSSEVWQQHDIQELYRVMFDALEHSFKNTDQAQLINNLYQGKWKDYVKCLDCGTENAREDSFLDVPLPIRPFGSNAAFKSVVEALRAFVEPELLTGNNKYECTNCATHCDAHKGLKFTSFPYMLTIHLKRFDFDYQTFHRIKLNDRVTFPSLLDLNDFTDEVTTKDKEKVLTTKDSEEVTNLKANEEVTTMKEKEDPSSSQAGSPSDKLDDASTTDSGSALDAEETSSAELNTTTLNDTDTQEEDEGIDVSIGYNEKNKNCLQNNGPHVYELFSIMIHSGSASGGHYYVYIKDFQTGEWHCFNDQNVTKITDEDIIKTFGGPNARGYYSNWTSSANAYMLMYRKADKERNVDVFSRNNFPPHIKELLKQMITEETAEREAREIDRMMCKIKVFSKLPNKDLTEKKLKFHMDTTLKDATKIAYEELELANEVPLERCRLVKYEEIHDNVESSFDNDENDSISQVLGGVKSTYKFDLFMEIRDQNKEFDVYKPGGITVKVYIVNITTEEVEGPEIIRASQSLTVRQFKELLGRHLSFDASKLRIVQERYYMDLKPLLSDTKFLKDEGFYRSNKVYIEGSGEESTNFYRGSRMFSVLDRYEHTITLHCKMPDCSEESLKEMQIPRFPVVEDAPLPPPASSHKQKTEQKIPEVKTPEDVESKKSSEALLPGVHVMPLKELLNLKTASTAEAVALSTSTRVTTSLGGCVSSSLDSAPPRVSCSTSQEIAAAAVASASAAARLSPVNNRSDQGALSDGDDEGIVDMDGAVGGSSSAVNSDQSASEDSSLTSDSDRTLVGEPPEDKLSNGSNSPDNYQHPSCSEDIDVPGDSIGTSWDASDTGWNYEEEEKVTRRYFRAELIEDNLLKVSVDKRITVGQLKTELQRHVGVAQENFKLFKYYSNSQEFECTRMTETLTCYGDVTVMKISLGRALLPGELKGKVFLLDFTNPEEPAKFLIDSVIRQGDSVLTAKKCIVKEVNLKCAPLKLDVERTRLRKKSWKNPLLIYLDHQILGADIKVFANWELYLQILEGPEIKTGDKDEVAIFLKRFRRSSYTTDPLIEIILVINTTDGLKQKISEVSGIPAENIDIAKGKSTFPCDMSVLDITADLDWNQENCALDQKPYYIMDDGSVIYYRDKTETAKSLSESERNSLMTKESARLKRDNITSFYNSTSSATSTVGTRTKERGLKIYLGQ